MTPLDPISPASAESGTAVGARAAVVVDELALVRLGVAALMADSGPEPVTVVADAAGGREAAELVRHHDADLVVVGAPADMPPVEAVRRCRAASSRARIVALLGTAQVAGVAGIVEAGAAGVALRGAGPADLRQAFAAVLGGARFVAPTLATGLVGRLESAEPGAAERGHDLLTSREREVLALVAGGATNREIATALSVTVATVKSHLVHLYAKLEVRNRQEALSRAVGLGLLT